MKLKSIIYIALVVTTVASCSDKMNYKEYSVYDEDYVKATFSRAAGVLTSAYNDLDYDFGNYNGAMLCSATDEAVYSHSGNAIENFYNGAWSPTNNNDASLWTKCWRGISYANLYLDEFTELTFDDYRTDLNYLQEMHQYNNFQYEARFLRAYYYFLLVRAFGGVPLKLNHMDAAEANALPRATADEVFEFIDKECVEIKDTIIKNYADLGTMALSAIESGRVNNLAVLALRARAALYHASPLFSQGKSEDEKKALWKAAAEANWAVINECRNRGMRLNPTYANLFNKDNWGESNECIFVRRISSASNQFEQYNFPIGLENAGGGNCPTQNLVDAYEMKNGKAIDEAGSGYDPQNPYADRDARMAVTVARNGEQWANTTLETFIGGANGQPIAYATPTSYYLKKYVNQSLTIGGTNTTTERHHWVIFRLGEFYLNYAEAMLNYTGDPYNGTAPGLSTTAAAAVNTVRTRAGQPNIVDGLTLNEFKNKYENERFVELAFEGHRFYDVRRWMEAEKYFKTIRGMQITKNADDTFTYTPVKVQDRQWDNKMYLFPLAQSEILKSGALEQNPGW